MSRTYFKELWILPLDDINNEIIALFKFPYFNKNQSSPFNDFFVWTNAFINTTQDQTPMFTTSKHEPATKDSQ